jgi:hypothetical protein
MMDLVEFLIPIPHAQRVMIHARLITRDLSTRSPYRARISTQFIDDMKMGEKKKMHALQPLPLEIVKLSH